MAAAVRDESHRAAAEAVISRSIAVFALVLCAQGVDDVLDDLPGLAPWWDMLFGGGAAITILWAAAASVRGRVDRWALGGFAVVIAGGLLTWSGAHPVPESGPPWLWHVLSLATACLAGAAGIKGAALYAVSTSVLFAVVRHSPSGGSASWDVAAEDAAYAAMVGIAVAVAIHAIRLGAERADTAEAHAVAAYKESAGARAQLIERHRLGAILHDSVMSALVAAAQAVTPEQRCGAARAAREGMRRLEEYAATEPARSPVHLVELPSRLQAVAENPAFLPVDIFSALPSSSPLTLPATVADALLEATFTALDNASRHSRASRATISIRVIGGRLRVEIADDGRGFDLGSVPPRRLGIRVSIIQRVVGTGGRAEVASVPGEGTQVLLEWVVEEQ